MSRVRIDAAWAKGLPACGVHCASADLAFYEIAGLSGCDFVWIDTEHAAVTLPMVLSGIAAAQSSGAAAVVRIAKNDPALAKPILEMGADGVIFPMINSAEEAEQAVRACLYPPAGCRGFGPLRASQYGTIPPQKYREESDKTILKVIQIEHVDGVRALDEILEVKGIDLVVCGPMDLSASVNKLGMLKDPEVRALMDSIPQKCRAAGVPYGISMGYDPELRDHWKSMGASFLSMGNPYIFFRQMTAQILAGGSPAAAPADGPFGGRP